MFVSFLVYLAITSEMQRITSFSRIDVILRSYHAVIYIYVYNIHNKPEYQRKLHITKKLTAYVFFFFLLR